MRVKISSLVKFYTMLLLFEGPRHGYEIMKELERLAGKRISASQVYPFLDLLSRKKLIKLKGRGARHKSIYSLTPEGRAFTNSVLNRAGDLLFLALKPRINSCMHCGCKIVEGGHKESINGKTYVFCCKHCARASKGR